MRGCGTARREFCPREKLAPANSLPVPFSYDELRKQIRNASELLKLREK